MDTVNRDGTADFTNTNSQPTFMFYGEYDTIFQYTPCSTEISDVYAATGLDSSDLKYEVNMADLGHVVDSRMFDVMMQWVNDGTVGSVDDYEQSDYYESDDWGDSSVSIVIVGAVLAGCAAFFWPLILANAVWMGPAAVIILGASLFLFKPDEGAWEEWYDEN